MSPPIPSEHSEVIERHQVRVSGTVQGVGFRPFVYRHAVALGLGGFVRNDSAGVLIEVQGRPPAITELCRRLAADAPPLARVASVVATPLPPASHCDRFVIDASGVPTSPQVAVTVDAGACDDCLAEVDDPSNRRFGYPFTNCTNCGPRYTIVRSVPYDRAATTMAAFVMCADCRREYDDPADRRFHAQPNACALCGPRLRYCDAGGRGVAEGAGALDAAVAALGAGAIVAVKGVGGFHIAVDATNADAVARLRRRKARDDKPFALMVDDLAMARRLVTLDRAAEAALCSPRRPIVLAARRPASMVAPAVAPGLPELGVLLPYTPLHHLLLTRLRRPLVLTSGNSSDDPIAYTDGDAAARLGPLVDAIVTHDRAIHIRCDDSVVRARRGRTQVLRRSRGLAPEPLNLPFASPTEVLAVGAELKNTVSVVKGDTLFASHHIGDLEHLATYQSFMQALEHLSHLFGVVPNTVAHDLHPEYLSTKVALDLGLEPVAVQHHHAHIASCLVDHGRCDRVLGVAFDGLGLGADGTFWGGEFMVADLDRFERVGHLQAVALPGGSAAIREPWRMAVSWLHHSLGPRVARSGGGRLDSRAAAVVALIDAPAAPRTSSMGRLFDGVAALVGLRKRVSYEGQAAIELEALAHTVAIGAVGPYPMERRWEGGQLVLDAAPLIAAVLADLSDDTPASEISAAFHEGVGLATVDAAALLAAAHELRTVALSGGVFQNARLTDIVVDGLESRGLEVLVHERVPPNDGGISIGQAAIAAFRGTL
jgi:hydrogenase maturation protein HypF